MNKLFYRWSALILFITEVFIALYIPSTSFIRHSLGDFLVVILIYCLIRSFIYITPWKLLLGVLTFSFTVEFAQYFHIVGLLGIENKILRIIMGTSFSVGDLVMYSLGCLITLSIELGAPKSRKMS